VSQGGGVYFDIILISILRGELFFGPIKQKYTTPPYWETATVGVSTESRPREKEHRGEGGSEPGGDQNKVKCLTN